MPRTYIIKCDAMWELINNKCATLSSLIVRFIEQPEMNSESICTMYAVNYSEWVRRESERARETEAIQESNNDLRSNTLLWNATSQNEVNVNRFVWQVHLALRSLCFCLRFFVWTFACMTSLFTLHSKIPVFFLLLSSDFSLFICVSSSPHTYMHV